MSTSPVWSLVPLDSNEEDEKEKLETLEIEPTEDAKTSNSISPKYSNPWRLTVKTADDKSLKLSSSTIENSESGYFKALCRNSFLEKEEKCVEIEEIYEDFLPIYRYVVLYTTYTFEMASWFSSTCLFVWSDRVAHFGCISTRKYV